MHDLDLILTLTGGLAAALVLGYATHRIGLSPIVGYLLAGIAIGPHTPGFVANRGFAEQFAEIGVVLLMFGVGLHFDLRDLLAVKRVAVPGAVGQSLFATLLAAVAAHACGLSWTAGIVFGLAVSVASTVVLVRVLADQRQLHTPTGHIAVGWLVVEDLFTVVVLVLLPALLDGGETAGDAAGAVSGGLGAIVTALGVATLKIGALVAFAFLVGGRAIPWLLERIAATHSRELFTLTVLVVALGIAVGSTLFFGVSMALGAFLAGMVVGRSDFSLRAAAEALPMRDAFAVLFFVSVGMLFDPRSLLESSGFVAATLLIILVGKPLAAFAIVRLLRYPLRTALAVAAALAQIGEFSFVLARLGHQLGVLPAVATDTLIAGAILSITVNPLLFRGVGRFHGWLARRSGRTAAAARATRPPSAVDAEANVSTDAPLPEAVDAVTEAQRAVVVGYGPVGRTVVRLLADNHLEPTIVEMNLETVRRLRRDGMRAIYGDATQREVLEEAGIAGAATLVVTVSELEGTADLIRTARELNPDLRVLARSNYVRERDAMRAAGATTIVSGEAEVALALAESVLRGLGATVEQIDRERSRVREELLGDDARNGS